MAQSTKSKNARSSSSVGSKPRSASTQARRTKGSEANRSQNEGASNAGAAVGSVAKKLKTPAIVAGTGLAGLAGGLALARHRHKKALGVSLAGRRMSKNLAGVAKNVGVLAERTGQVAEQVRVVSEALGQHDGPRRSPIEVVLEGLTRRSQATRPR